MRRLYGLLLLCSAPLLTACPKDPPGSGPTPAPTPTLTTGCQFGAQQPTVGLSMTCSVSGGLPDTAIDPTAGNALRCRPPSVLLSGQTVTVPLTVIYGANGDENTQRVRLDANLANSTHNGQLGKANADCSGTSGPRVPVTTTFAGKHIALIDKSKAPACVFESRLDLSSYSQTVGQGLPLPTGFATKDSVTSTLSARLDLELARAVNGLLQPSANVNESGFVGRSGRCDNDYKQFSGN